MSQQQTPLPHYSMLIEWSEEDQVFYVTLPEWEHHHGIHVWMPVTHGSSYEEAARNGQEALQALIESTLAEGEPLPAPRVVVA